MRNYSAKEYNAVPQNWAVVQDKRGVMYFGNNQGILEYDGVNWRMMLVPGETTIRSLAMDSNGIIYVGAQGEVGFMQADSSGDLKYESLNHLIPEKDRNFEDVWTCYATTDGIYFQSSDKIFRYKNNAINVWYAEETRTFHKMFYVYNHLFVRQRFIGLLELKDDRLNRLPGGEMFAEENLYFMSPYPDSAQNKILLNTGYRGLFLMELPPADRPLSQNSVENYIRITPFQTAVDPFFFKYKVYNEINLSNNFFSIGTNDKGITIIDKAGNLVDFLSKDIGLQDESIKTQYLDNENNLWLGLNNGITRIDITSPVTMFNDANGLNGVVQAIVRFRDTIYAATNMGVFYLVPRSTVLNSKNPKPEYPHFVQVKDYSDECWSMLEFSDLTPPHLLVASNTGIYQVEKNKVRRIIECNPWILYRSRSDKSRVFIGTVSGLSSCYWDKNKWVYEGPLSDLNEEVIFMSEDKEGNLWMGGNQGVLRIKSIHTGGPVNNPDISDQIQIERFDSSSGIPQEYVYISEAGNKVLFASEGELYRYYNNRFIPDSSFGIKFVDGTRGIHRIVEDPQGNIWMPNFATGQGKYELGFFRKSGEDNYEFVSTAFNAFADELPHTVFCEPDGVTWLGGPMGIMRFDNNVQKVYDFPFNALIRKVVHLDSVLFNGTYYDNNRFVTFEQPPELKITIPYILNSLTFEFAATTYNNGSRTLYSYYLEGFDKHWSDWKNETKAVYTNLPEGTYYFRVKAKNIYGYESREGIYEFTILPPWFRTWWAYTSYVLLFIGFVYGAIYYSTRGLQAIIRERTAEIVKQKEVIEAKNHDILDSINYAKRIQDALLPHPQNIQKMFPKYFILYKPRDIVSGDFYWCGEKDGLYLITAADCTGHGVPGAFMSMIGHSLLNETVVEKGITKPSDILDMLRAGVIRALGQTGQTGEQKDGMDMALIMFDNKKMLLEYSGANNPLYIVRNREVIETKADKMPIGIYGGNYKAFTNHSYQLQKGDKVYMSSDGYGDQFGGPDGKKFMKKRFKDLLVSIFDTPISQQKEILDKTFENWKTVGNTGQMDDVLVIGFEV